MSAVRCGATCRDGTACSNPPMRGQARCRMHGGSSPQARAKGAERAAEASLRAEVDVLAQQPVTDPVKWLQDVAGEVDQWLRLCREHLSEAVSVEESGATIRLYERALGRALDAADRMNRLGIDTKFLENHQARIGQAQASQFIALLNAALARLDLTPEQRDQVPGAVTAAIDTLELEAA